MKKDTQIPLIIANWKMHPKTLRDAENLFTGVRKKTMRLTGVRVVVCPPTLYLGHLLAGYQGSTLSFGAQDVFSENTGSHTGMISPQMLRDNGVEYALIGHSEMRKTGETNLEVAQKVSAARKSKLSVVLCVGEQERDEEGEYLRTLEEQIKHSLEGVSRVSVTNDFYVAYEPLWAIGKKASDALPPQGVHQMVLFIKKVLSKKYGKKVGMGIPILYGGSVETKNAATLFSEGGIVGALIGHASLDADDFATIVKEAKSTRQ